MFILLSPSTTKGHGHEVLSTQYLTHFVITVVLFGSTPFDYALTLNFTSDFNDKVHTITKEEKSL